MIYSVDGSCYVLVARSGIDVNETPSIEIYITHLLYKDNYWQTVWLGWHPAERISVGPNG